MEKHSVSRLSYLFAHLHLLSSDSFSSTLLSSNLSLLSALLCFSSVHIVGSLTSKLPSITTVNITTIHITTTINITTTTAAAATTSSTAQGGGGSFKNRKPIGEVGCCESGMAERSH